ncbi:ferrous iron transport protein B [Sulfurospirillum barnesii]|uniref:Ferrous iron transport protein B n=1 Tax=Sulfurospirillum barnesii (strain ATCC 700032 / DSM 10660 / SES-3) TaxID=760154 RepID=I3XY84_SULBS|nr:ferrous iron transport protein B [Sulfurospirillum barnesii]AFL68908.1 ferrous iron transporter FeoB [Sulfurospirillum barnesii SES-3]
MIKVALAGQPNCGKSTIFNLVSGIHQHVANYPGVTVDKKVGRFDYQNEKIEMVDLPGTYSFSSYSLEERVSKEFLYDESPDIIVNIVDASNIKRHLYLTFQLLEIGIPVVIVLNMMDVASRRGIYIDHQKIEEMLGVPVVCASGAKGEGGEAIMQAIVATYHQKEQYQNFKMNYEELESSIQEIETELIHADVRLNRRWMAIKILEEDKALVEKLGDEFTYIQEKAQRCEERFHQTYDKDIGAFLAAIRYDSADLIFHKCVKVTKLHEETLTDKVDKIVLNRWLAFPILLLVMFLVYELSIVYGYKLTDYTWPLLAMFKNVVIDILPEPDLIDVPMITDLSIWMVNSANALINYIPIFFILFALIAIMEDVGYMPRLAFILDKVFKKFGLHGQSTLPLVLGGAMVGGCAVPGVMSTKGIADERARMATILAVPYMNCLAKVPFYTLILGAFFKEEMGLMMFYISTVTLFIALIVSKLLTSTVLKTRETAPFVMELPPYHLPTFKGVIIRAAQRVWVYIKKVVTIVLAVAIILFAMLQFPGLSQEGQASYNEKVQTALSDFDRKVAKSSYYTMVDSKEKVSALVNYYDNYKAKRMVVSGSEGAKNVDEAFMRNDENLFRFVKPENDKDAKIINTALRTLSNVRKDLLRQIKNEKIENSFLGMLGHSMEPITQFAGFDWKINVAFLSSFAARESAVATLGSLYENNKADSKRAEEAMYENSGYSPLHAVAIIIFMVLTPPCIATMIVVKMQANSYKWMLFAILFPITLGIIISSFIFSFGSVAGWSGVEAMSYFYVAIVFLALFLGLMPNRQNGWFGGFRK